jgi:hypothetical protein
LKTKEPIRRGTQGKPEKSPRKPRKGAILPSNNPSDYAENSFLPQVGAKKGEQAADTAVYERF